MKFKRIWLPLPTDRACLRKSIKCVYSEEVTFITITCVYFLTSRDFLLFSYSIPFLLAFRFKFFVVQPSRLTPVFFARILSIRMSSETLIYDCTSMNKTNLSNVTTSFDRSCLRVTDHQRRSSAYRISGSSGTYKPLRITHSNGKTRSLNIHETRSWQLLVERNTITFPLGKAIEKLSYSFVR